MAIADQWAHHVLAVNFGVEAGSKEDIYFNSTITIDELCRNNFSNAWIIIKEIFEKYKDSEIIIGNLSSGPIEDILVYYGADALDAIKEYCKSNESFREVLLGVWRNAINQNVWCELQKLIEEN